MTLQFGTRVITPIGPGHVDAIMAGTEKRRILVSHRRSEFPPEEWASLSPANGPSVFREYEISDLTVSPVPFAVKTTQKFAPQTWSDVVRGLESNVQKTEKKKRKVAPLPSVSSASITKKERPPAGTIDLSSITVGMRVRTRRNGDIYEIIKIENGVARLSWTAGSYTRDVKISGLLSYYDLVEGGG